MTQFQCLGPTCPTNCCNDWQVPVDKPAYDRISRVLRKTPSGHALLSAAIVPGGVSHDGRAPFAHIQHGATGECPFLAPERLCSLHRDHGEAILPDGCSVFPRAALQVGQRLELGGRLACPEVARLALLQEDGVDLVDLGGTVVPRAIPGKTISVDEKDVYTWAFDDVRNVVLDVLRRAEFPLPVRMALLADLAERLRPFFFRGTHEFDGSRRELSERRLLRELSVNTDAAAMGALRQDLDGLKVSLAPLVELLATLVVQRLRLPSSPEFQSLAEHVLEGYGGTSGTPRKLRDLGSAAAWFQQRGARLQQLYGGMLERFQRNWSLLYWTQDPYTESPSVMDHLCRNMVRLGTLRFLVLGHPDVVSVVDNNQAGQEDVVANAMVDVARLWARAFEHHPNVLKLLHGALELHGPNTFGRAICLSKLF